MNNPQVKAILERVSFQTRHISIRASEKSDALIARAKELHPFLYEKYKDNFDEMLWLLPLTTGITFNFKGDEMPMLQEFREFWTAFIAATHDEDRQIKLAMDWRLDTHRDLIIAWYEAIQHGNYPIKHELTPEPLLSDQEQQELAEKTSPLA